MIARPTAARHGGPVQGCSGGRVGREAEASAVDARVSHRTVSTRTGWPQGQRWSWRSVVASPPRHPSQRLGVADRLAMTVVGEVDEHLRALRRPLPDAVGPPPQVVVGVGPGVEVMRAATARELGGQARTSSGRRPRGSQAAGGRIAPPDPDGQSGCAGRFRSRSRRRRRVSSSRSWPARRSGGLGRVRRRRCHRSRGTPRRRTAAACPRQLPSRS